MIVVPLRKITSNAPEVPISDDFQKTLENKEISNDLPYHEDPFWNGIAQNLIDLGKLKDEALGNSVSDESEEYRSTQYQNFRKQKNRA